MGVLCKSLFLRLISEYHILCWRTGLRELYSQCCKDAPSGSHHGCQGASSCAELVFWFFKMESQQDPVIQQNWSSCRPFCLLSCCPLWRSQSQTVSVSNYKLFWTRSYLQRNAVTSDLSEPSLNLRSACSEWLVQSPVLTLWVRDEAIVRQNV